MIKFEEKLSWREFEEGELKRQKFQPGNRGAARYVYGLHAKQCRGDVAPEVVMQWAGLSESQLSDMESGRGQGCCKDAHVRLAMELYVHRLANDVQLRVMLTQVSVMFSDRQLRSRIQIPPVLPLSVMGAGASA